MSSWGAFYQRVLDATAFHGEPLVGPTALKLRLDLIEDVEGPLYFRFNIWSWQLVAKMDTKVVCNRLEMGKRYRFFAKKEIETLQAYTSDACNIRRYKEICLIR